jgi:hypothetical protein
VAGGCKRQHNEDLHDSYASPNFIMAIKSTRMRWAGHIAYMGEVRNAYRILEGNTEETTWKTEA